MSAVRSIDQMLAARELWHGRPAATPTPAGSPTGIAGLDSALPHAGWPPGSLTELLVPTDGVGELEILWPTLARLTNAPSPVALISPPYIPYAPAWHLAGVALDQLVVIRTDERSALWAAEQCLRSGACAAVLCWPRNANDRALRRLQVAAETGQCLGFAFRASKVADNPSPAALRIQLEGARRVRVIKCRGATPPALSMALPPLTIH